MTLIICFYLKIPKALERIQHNLMKKHESHASWYRFKLNISSHYECRAVFTEQPLIISPHKPRIPTLPFTILSLAQTKAESNSPADQQQSAFHFTLKGVLKKSTTDFHINHGNLLFLYPCVRVCVIRFTQLASVVLLVFFMIPPLLVSPNVMLENVKYYGPPLYTLTKAHQIFVKDLWNGER